MTKRVFIVEDDHTCENILRRVIQSIDPEVVVDCVDSAEQAMRMLTNEHRTGHDYNLIIADIFLSGRVTGVELYQECTSQYPETPVLVTSGLPVDQFFETLGKNTISPPFLAKPFYVGECKQIIEGLLSLS